MLSIPLWDLMAQILQVVLSDDNVDDDVEMIYRCRADSRCLRLENGRRKKSKGWEVFQ